MPAPPDSSVGPDDAGVTVCAADGECDNGMFCDGDERCAPGTAGAGPNGCVSGIAPCAGAACDESVNACECDSMPDADGDGHDSIFCGGDDCDDGDERVNPGVEEICDAAGVNEDCDNSTLAGSADGDSDTDGFVSASCCNTQADGMLLCGGDCADDDININPGAVESCNGMDDSCSLDIDDGGGLCPGGLCVAGGCQFNAWDRSFGGDTTDDAIAVAVDSLGNVYVVGWFRNTADFGDGPRTVPQEAGYVAKYGADGAFNWAYVGPNAGFFRSGFSDVAVSSDGSQVYVVGGTDVDLGSGGTTGGFILELNGATGAYVDDVRFGAGTTRLQAIAVDGSSVTVTGSFGGTVSWGGASRVAGGAEALVVARFGLDLSYTWDSVFSVDGASASRRARGTGLDLRADGRVVVGGEYRDGILDVAGPMPAAGSTGDIGFVAEFSAAGSPTWSHPIVANFGSAQIHDVAALSGGGAVAVGQMVGTLDPMSGDPVSMATDANGIILGLDAAGAPDWFRGFGSLGGFDRATAVADDGIGPVIVGSFSTDTSFGGATRRPVGRANGFFARYSETGSHRNDARYGSGTGGTLSVRDVATGPGGSTVIVGSFDGVVDFGGGATVSTGFDAFILRLGS